MRYLVLLVSVLAVSGCAEVIRGPRVVQYSEDTRFYVRSVPTFTTAGTAEALPVQVCEEQGKIPRKLETYQDTWLDTEYTIYSCVQGQPDAPAPSSS